MTMSTRKQIQYEALSDVEPTGTFDKNRLNRAVIRMKLYVRHLLNKIGVDVVRYRPTISSDLPPDFEEYHKKIINQVSPYTLTSAERIFALIQAVRYILTNGINGDLVECGVYKGGSVMVMALTLLEENSTDRELYLFDTFAGMPSPGREDVDFRNEPTLEIFEKHRISEFSSIWCNSSQDQVKRAVFSTGYPRDNFHFIEGMVEHTLPREKPKHIALLRLDTDWYNSTKHELEHLYHRVSPGGIVIIDDYGHFQGSRKATDEFFSTFSNPPFLNRIDYSGRLIIKGLD